jgi:hypothetical protein
MAIEFNIPEDKVFMGENKKLRFKIYQADGVTPLDLTGRSLIWVVRKTDKASDPAILSKATAGAAGIAIVGAYNVDPTINTQVAEVSIDAADTSVLRPLTYRHSMKEVTDTTILSFGDFPLAQATAR